jgi:hypothetical protein
MRLTTRNPVMRGASFLLDELEMRLARCDQWRMRCDLPRMRREVREIAAIAGELTELCGADRETEHDGADKVQDSGAGRR